MDAFPGTGVMTWYEARVTWSRSKRPKELTKAYLQLLLHRMTISTLRIFSVIIGETIPQQNEADSKEIRYPCCTSRSGYIKDSTRIKAYVRGKTISPTLRALRRISYPCCTSRSGNIKGATWIK